MNTRLDLTGFKQFHPKGIYQVLTFFFLSVKSMKIITHRRIYVLGVALGFFTVGQFAVKVKNKPSPT